MLQIREQKSDQSLGLFWDGNKFSSINTAKTFASYREAAKEASKIAYGVGAIVSIVPQVTTASAAQIQSDSTKEKLTAVESITEEIKTPASISRSQHGNFS